MTTMNRLDVSRAGKNLLSLIGNTPLVRLKKIADESGIGEQVEVYGKAEFFNPGGSVKDRPALAIIETAEQSGLLTQEKILLDATSGNTGIAYAMICAVKGYRATLCLPESASNERKTLLKVYGAELILTPRAESSDGAIRKARELYAAQPGKYFYADQYSNDANWQSHFNTTAVEIWEQTSGRITDFVAAIGTSGTFTGTVRRLKKYNPTIRAVSVQPDVAVHGLEGVKHLESAMVPKIYDASLPEKTVEVATETAYAYAKKLARTEGLFLGVSAAANVYAALQVARELSQENKAGVVVTVLCDGGMKYLSEPFWK
ncbi:MAG: cysteine synthase family protein [Rhizobacter sp.]|nr:cysteine synthase family protein [Chlorobiales bacterium]